MTANHLLDLPQDVVHQLLQRVHSSNLSLDVSMPVLTIDQHRCGKHIEGMIWPGEVENYIKKLKERGIIPDYISYDLPLTAGKFSADNTGCKLSIKQIAQRVGKSAKVLRAAFPKVRLVDSEVPTGIDTRVWLAGLREWLTEYQATAGEQLYGMTLDVWWEFPWTQVVAGSVSSLHSENVKVGIFIDSDGGRDMSGKDWIEDAERNHCRVTKANLPIDYSVVASWTSRHVKNVPVEDTDSLAFLLSRYQSICAQ